MSKPNNSGFVVFPCLRFRAARILSLGLACVALLAQWPFFGAAQKAANEISMTAKNYEFTPAAITVKKGERVKLVITALDRDHGFQLQAFGINQILKKGQAATVEFTADKAGSFQFQCSKFCGLGHGRMKGQLIVEEAASP